MTFSDEVREKALFLAFEIAKYNSTPTFGTNSYQTVTPYAQKGIITTKDLVKMAKELEKYLDQPTTKEEK